MLTELYRNENSTANNDSFSKVCKKDLGSILLLLYCLFFVTFIS